MSTADEPRPVEGIVGQPRYILGTGGDDEPELLLVIDTKAHLVVARSSIMAEYHVRILVDLANRA